MSYEQSSIMKSQPPPRRYGYFLWLQFYRRLVYIFFLFFTSAALGLIAVGLFAMSTAWYWPTFIAIVADRYPLSGAFGIGLMKWNAAKASINKKKHGVSFDEAQTVFFDENAKVLQDPDHSLNTKNNSVCIL